MNCPADASRAFGVAMGEAARGDATTEAAGMTLARRARLRMSRSDLAYLPAGTGGQFVLKRATHCLLKLQPTLPHLSPSFSSSALRERVGQFE